MTRVQLFYPRPNKKTYTFPEAHTISYFRFILDLILLRKVDAVIHYAAALEPMCIRECLSKSDRMAHLRSCVYAFFAAPRVYILCGFRDFSLLWKDVCLAGSYCSADGGSSALRGRSSPRN